jgi:hypothetical protein
MNELLTILIGKLNKSDKLTLRREKIANFSHSCDLSPTPNFPKPIIVHVPHLC